MRQSESSSLPLNLKPGFLQTFNGCRDLKESQRWLSSAKKNLVFAIHRSFAAGTKGRTKNGRTNNFGGASQRGGKVAEERKGAKKEKSDKTVPDCLHVVAAPPFLQ